MKSILSILLCFISATQMFAQSVTKLCDTLVIDDGVIGEIKQATPLIGTDSLGKYLQSKITPRTLSDFYNRYADEITFELQIDSNGNLGKLRPIYNFEHNENICTEIIKNLKLIPVWKPAMTVVNGQHKNIDSKVLMFVYITKGVNEGEARITIHIK